MAARLKRSPDANERGKSRVKHAFELVVGVESSPILGREKAAGQTSSSPILSVSTVSTVSATAAVPASPAPAITAALDLSSTHQPSQQRSIWQQAVSCDLLHLGKRGGQVESCLVSACYCCCCCCWLVLLWSGITNTNVLSNQSVVCVCVLFFASKVKDKNEDDGHHNDNNKMIRTLSTTAVPCRVAGADDGLLASVQAHGSDSPFHDEEVHRGLQEVLRRDHIVSLV